MAGRRYPRSRGLAAADRGRASEGVLFDASPAKALERLTGGGTEGNERLTITTGVLLIALLAVIGLTLLALRPLLSVHLFVGMLLIGPVALKMASTGYRFVRYYTHDAAYRSVGPPPTALRLIAPIVVTTTVVVLASGVALLFVGPSSRGTLLPIHKVSFIVWAAFTGLHLLGHLPSLPALSRPDHLRVEGPPGYRLGGAGRVLSLTAALIAGLAIALLTLPQFGPWLHAHFHHH